MIRPTYTYALLALVGLGLAIQACDSFTPFAPPRTPLPVTPAKRETPTSVSPTVGYPSSAAQSLGTDDVSKWACPTTEANCNNLIPRFNWVLAVADQESQAGWQAYSNWPRSQAELSTTQLKLNYILALQWNASRGEWVMDATSSVVPPAERTIGFVSGCDNKPGFCTRNQAIDTAVTAMAKAAYTGWDNGVTGQCAPGYWENPNNIFSYTNLGNAVAPYSTPSMDGGTQLNYLNPDVSCKTLNGLSMANGCACRDATGAPSVDDAVTIVDSGGQPCAWSTPDDFTNPSLNNSGQTPHYLLPVHYDAWGEALSGGPSVASELAKLFSGAGDWQTKFAPASMNNASTQGLGPPAMMFLISVVGPANRFALFAMNQVILNRGADNEGQCTSVGGNCWANGAGEYDFLESPFWGRGQARISTAFQACNNPPYYIYDAALSMDRLYLTSFNSSGQCNPMVQAPAAGGAGSSSFFQTTGMQIDKSKGLAPNTWLYAFVIDASGIQSFRFRGDQVASVWPNMPVSSSDVRRRQGNTISSWNGTSVTPTSPPPQAQRISQKPTSGMLEGAWTPAWSANATTPAGLYMPACKAGSSDQGCVAALKKLPGGINWWNAYSSILDTPDSTFVPGVDTTLSYCVDASAQKNCGAACSVQPASPLGVMYDPSCANGGVGCNWGNVTNCRLCMPQGCTQSGTTQYVSCPASP